MPEQEHEIQTSRDHNQNIKAALADLYSEDSATREAAASVLSSLNPEVIREVLAKIVEGGNFNFNREAGIVISSFSERGLPFLFEALKSEDPLLAKAASSAFWQVDEVARDPAVQGLTDLLLDPMYTKIAARSFLWIRPSPTEANEALQTTFNDPRFKVASIKTLWRINESNWNSDPNSFPFENDPVVRIQAASILLCINRSVGFEIVKKVVIPQILNESPSIQDEVLRFFRLFENPSLEELLGVDAIDFELDEDESSVAKELFAIRNTPSKDYYLKKPSSILVGIVASEYKAGSEAARILVEKLAWEGEEEIANAAVQLQLQAKAAEDRERRIHSFFDVVPGLIDIDPWKAKVAEKRLLAARGEAIPALSHSLEKSDSYELKQSVLRVLRIISCDESHGAAESVISCASDKEAESSLRTYAIQTLGLSCAKSPHTLPYLLKLIEDNLDRSDDSSSSMTEAALQALTLAKGLFGISIPGDAFDLISKLIKPLPNDSCLLALGLIDSRANLDEKAIRSLISLESSDTKAAAAIFKALNEIGPKLLPVIAKDLKNGTEDEKKAAYSALIIVRNLKPSDLVEYIIESDSKDRDPFLRAMSTLSGDSIESLIGVEKLLTDQDPETKIAGATALYNASCETTEFADLLFSLGKDDSEAVRQKAAMALGKADGRLEELIASHFETSNGAQRVFLSTALLSASRYMFSSRLLAEIGNRMLKDSNPEIRRNAVEAAASWNQLEEERVLALVNVLFDKDQSVRESASRSILAIDPKGALSGEKIISTRSFQDDVLALEAVKLLGKQRYQGALDSLMVIANGKVSEIQIAARKAVDEIYGSEYR